MFYCSDSCFFSSCFFSFRTNLPKEIMGFRDYPMPQSSESYISSEKVLSYIISYAGHFNLNELIKFKRHVTRVRIADANKWEVCVCVCVNVYKVLQHNKSKTKRSIYKSTHFVLFNLWYAIDFLGRCQVTVKDLASNTVETSIFDAIFVCNGHNSVPFIPKYDGIDEFQGRHMHSHDYRRADAFKGLNQS